MANVQHSTLTDPYLHEPKGASTATADQLYRSNGSGSGTWTNASRFPGTGWGKYTNTTYVSTTALAISTTDVLLPFTTDDTVTQLPIAFDGTTSSLLDTSTEILKFIATGGLQLVTLTYKVLSVASAPTYMDIKVYGSSNGSTYATSLMEKTVPLTKGAGQVITETFLLPVTANMVTYGAKIYLATNVGTANIINIGLTSARVHKAR